MSICSIKNDFGQKFLALFLSSFLTLLITGCLFDGKESNSNSYLIKQVDPTAFVKDSSEIFLEAYDSISPSALAKMVPPQVVGFEITETSNMPAVVVDGFMTQATAMARHGNEAIVGYNSAGEVFKGALQFIEQFARDTTGTQNNPKVFYEFHMSGLEINVITVVGNVLYFGGAADQDEFSGGSFVGKVELNNLSEESINASLKFYKSFGTTDILVQSDQVFISVGAKEGGVFELNTDLDSVGFWPATDVRSLYELQGELYALQGNADSEANQANLLQYDEESNQWKSIIELGELESDYQRAELSSDKSGNLVVAIGDQGVKAFSLEDKSLVWSLANPTSEVYEVQANGLALSGEILFSALGEWGVEFRSLSEGSPSDALGFIDFRDLTVNNQNYSANTLLYSANRLMVSSGVGGLQVYDFE